ncbi:thiamine phosphate synthase [Serinicoccus chungangensis]|uniref:thiamine phosphate synthase n=1 Tax=Serinicoccus chungangensis TaxID=767452 RepID=UPI0009FAB58B|nr:thiamine phosphate synthase [Serinicoccus chungangensis]
MRPSCPGLALYLVTDTALLGRRRLASSVRAAVDGGVTTVQLRDPHATDHELVALGVVLREALLGSGVPLIVNDRVDLVREIGAAGAHIGQGDLPVEEARRRLGPEAYLGLSCTTVEQVRAATALGPGTVDYLGLGPVWPTASKPDHAAPLGLDGLRELAEAAGGVPTVAIGGITRERAAGVAETPVDGLAVVSAICAAADPQAAATGLRTTWAAARGCPGSSPPGDAAPASPAGPAHAAGRYR